MRFSKLLVFALAVAGLAGCSLMTTPSSELVIHSPSEGQTFQIGQSTTISWECRNCDAITASSVEINLSPEGGGGIPFSYEIGRDFLSGKRSWVAGTVEGGIVEPGLYFIHIGADCTTPEGSGYCTRRSGLFRLTR